MKRRDLFKAALGASAIPALPAKERDAMEKLGEMITPTGKESGEPWHIDGPLTGKRVRLLEEYWGDAWLPADPNNPEDLEYALDCADEPGSIPGCYCADIDMPVGSVGTIGHRSNHPDTRYTINWDDGLWIDPDTKRKAIHKNAYSHISIPNIEKLCEVIG